jgi:mRNA-degrading endonuclease YafQ of YafQ-DinJ toxin-antitoxin module
MRYTRTNRFKRDYKRLEPGVQKVLEKKLLLLIENPSYPSLRTKRVRKTRDIWEVSLTKQYRITFQVFQDEIVLRRVGSHRILQNP